jgi:transposase
MESTKKARRPRRNFTPEFKADVVRLCRAEGNVSEVCKRMDLTETSVRRWIEIAKESEGGGGATGALRSEEREELERLRRELKRVTTERMRDRLSRPQRRVEVPGMLATGECVRSALDGFEQRAPAIGIRRFV